MSKTNKLINISVAVFFVVVLAGVVVFYEGKLSRLGLQQIRTSMRLDSLERSLLRWELYTENLHRTLQEQPPVGIDSLLQGAGVMSSDRAAGAVPPDKAASDSTANGYELEKK